MGICATYLRQIYGIYGYDTAFNPTCTWVTLKERKSFKCIRELHASDVQHMHTMLLVLNVVLLDTSYTFTPPRERYINITSSYTH